MSFCDRSFLITAGITTVICGLICYYLYTRMRELELALVKQSQVLSSFIANVQHEFRMGRREPNNSHSNELASAEAIDAVASLVESQRKIVINDNESVSDSDSESDSDSDNESVSDNENENENKLVIYDVLPDDVVTNDNLHGNIKIIDISVSNVANSYIEMLSDDESDESESDNEHEPDIAPKNNIITVEKIELTDLVSAPVSAPADDMRVDDVRVDDVRVDDMRVDDLRKLVVEKGLVSKEEVKKLKKNELLAVLKK